MDDRLELAEPVRIREHDARRAPPDRGCRPAPSPRARTARTTASWAGSPGRGHGPRDVVRVDHRRAELRQPAGDLGLAAADRPGDPDAHGAAGVQPGTTRALRRPRSPSTRRHGACSSSSSQASSASASARSTSASSLVTRRISTKLAATAGVPSRAPAGCLPEAEARQLAVEGLAPAPVGLLRQLLADFGRGRRDRRRRPRRRRRCGGVSQRLRSPRRASVRRPAPCRGWRVAPPRPRRSSPPRPPPATRGSRRRTAPRARRRPPTAARRSSRAAAGRATRRRSSRRLGEERLDRLAGGDVEVVRRLVEQEQVGRQDAQQGELEARPLAARQQADLLEHVVAAEQEPGEVPAGLAGGDRDRLEDGVEDGRARDRGVAQLGEVGGLHVVAEGDRPVERRQVARDRPQQRRLARAVRPDDADPLAALRRRGTGSARPSRARSASEPSGRSAPRPGR